MWSSGLCIPDKITCMKKTLTVLSVCNNIALLKPRNKEKCMTYIRGGRTFFNNFECSRGRKVIPNMKQICRGVEGFKIILKISLHICVSLKRFLECSSKMSYFGFKSQIFLTNGDSGIKYFKLKGCQESLEGHMWPAGSTLAMSDIHDEYTVLHVSVLVSIIKTEVRDPQLPSNRVP